MIYIAVTIALLPIYLPDGVSGQLSGLLNSPCWNHNQLRHEKHCTTDIIFEMPLIILYPASSSRAAIGYCKVLLISLKKEKNIYLAGDFMTAIWRACPAIGRYPKAAKPIKLLKMCYLILKFLIIICMHLVTPLDK